MKERFLIALSRVHGTSSNVKSKRGALSRLSTFVENLTTAELGSRRGRRSREAGAGGGGFWVEWRTAERR
nr:hypothetical protein Iba_chr05bCG0360 [Ipomoea batatas]